MWEFLSKIDPNTLVGVFTAVAGLATWAYHKVRGDKQESAMDMLTGIGKQVIHVVVTDTSINNDANVATITARVTAELWALASRTGVPRNAITEAIANQVIAHTVGDILTELRKRAAALDQAQAAIKALPTIEQVRSWFAPPVLKTDP